MPPRKSSASVMPKARSNELTEWLHQLPARKRRVFIYLANSTTRFSRMIFTLISPGYLSSSVHTWGIDAPNIRYILLIHSAFAATTAHKAVEHFIDRVS